MQLKRKQDRRLKKKIKVKSPADDTNCCAVFFSANTSYGAVSVEACMDGVGKASAKVSDALCALVLGVVEDKIQFVEEWLRCTLDIKPCIARANSSPQVFTLKDKSADASSISVCLPVQHWTLIPVLSMAYLPDNWDICWSGYRGVLTLSRLSLSESDARSVKFGSIILLPESFGSTWISRLSVPGLSSSMRGVFDASTAQWKGDGELASLDAVESVVVVDEPGSDTTSPEGATELGEITEALVECPMTLSVKNFMSDSESVILPVSEFPTDVPARLRLSNGQSFSGHIAPVASGYALYLSTHR